LAAIDEVYANKDSYIKSMQTAGVSDGVSACIKVIEEACV